MFLKFPYVTIGLSYVFFRVLHLIIDAHQKSVGSAVSAIDYANYTLNFTSLVSGPIQRFQDYHRMQNGPPLALDEAVVGQALERIALGYKWKCVAEPLIVRGDPTTADLERCRELGQTFAAGLAYGVF